MTATLTRSNHSTLSWQFERLHDSLHTTTAAQKVSRQVTGGLRLRIALDETLSNDDRLTMREFVLEQERLQASLADNFRSMGYLLEYLYGVDYLVAASEACPTCENKWEIRPSACGICAELWTPGECLYCPDYSDYADDI